MEALEAIMTRRSIRAFTSQPVSAETIEKLLKAAMSAPSACNQQPWHFVVITDRQMLQAIPRLHPYAGMAAQAALAVLVCADPDLQTCPGHWTEDCSAATENLLLAAHALGLGAVWTAVYPSEERIAAFHKFVNLPERVIPLCLVPIGYPAEPAGEVDRYRTDRIHSNRW